MTNQEFINKFKLLEKTYYELSDYQEDYEKLDNLIKTIPDNGVQNVNFDNNNDIDLDFNNKFIKNTIKSDFRSIQNIVFLKRNKILEKYIEQVKEY